MPTGWLQPGRRFCLLLLPFCWRSISGKVVAQTILFAIGPVQIQYLL
jgi:hypothetical protein